MQGIAAVKIQNSQENTLRLIRNNEMSLLNVLHQYIPIFCYSTIYDRRVITTSINFLKHVNISWITMNVESEQTFR